MEGQEGPAPLTMARKSKHAKSNQPNPKRDRFVREYLVDLNAKQAAIRAGYSPKTAESQGSRLLSNAKVKAAVEAGMSKTAKRLGISQERVLAELELLAFSDVTHYDADASGNVALAPGAPAGAMRALQSIKRRFTTSGSGDSARTLVEVEVKLWDKPGPLKLAGRHVGLFPDRLEVTGQGGGPVQTADLSALSLEELLSLRAMLAKAKAPEGKPA